MFLHYINTKQKHIKVFFLPNANKYPHQIFSTSTLLAHSPHPLRCSFSTSLHPLIYSIRQRRKNAHETVSISASPSTVPVFSSSFYIMLHMCILWCVSNFFAYEKKTYSEKYEWASLLLLLSEFSISALPSHSCLHVQELHTTHIDRQTDTHTHTHTHTHNVYYYKNVSIILMFTYENKKYMRSSKLTM